MWYNTRAMNRRWSPNWLVVFTICLLITATTMFVVTIKDQVGLKKCVYGGGEYGVGQSIPEEPKCYCNNKGVVVCDTPVSSDSEIDNNEYINDNLSFSSSFLNLLDVRSNFQSVRFAGITSTEDGIRVVVERQSMCNDDGELPPQIGYYMFKGTDLYLTSSTNLLAGSFGKECMVSNIFIINTDSPVSKIYYQAEDKEVFSADICVFNGNVYNVGDAFVGDSGEVVVCE